MARTNGVLAQARKALTRNRNQLQTELDAVDRALAALQGIGRRTANRRVRRTRRKSGASPRLLAALKKARAARKKKLAERRAAAG